MKIPAIPVKLPRSVVDRKFRLARVWSNDELRRVAHLFGGRIVNVSGWKDEDKEGGRYRDYFSAADTYHVTNWGGTKGFQGLEEEIFLDLAGALPPELERAFDVVFNHTVLEHIFDVQTAFRNLCAMSGDVVILVVPFAQVQHETDTWKDYWRFTPSWVREAFAREGFEALYVSANDDANAATYVFAIAARDGARWRDRLPAAPRPRMAASWLGRSRWRTAVGILARKTGG